MKKKSKEIEKKKTIEWERLETFLRKLEDEENISCKAGDNKGQKS